MGGEGSGKNREAERLARINWILKLISKRIIKKDACLGLAQLKYGCSRRTTLEYIGVLVNTAKIKEDNGLLRKN